MEIPPSPKSQFHSTDPVEALAKTVGALRQTFCEVNAATGRGKTVAARMVVVWQLLLEVAVSTTM